MVVMGVHALDEIQALLRTGPLSLFEIQTITGLTLSIYDSGTYLLSDPGA